MNGLVFLPARDGSQLEENVLVRLQNTTPLELDGVVAVIGEAEPLAVIFEPPNVSIYRMLSKPTTSRIIE